MVIADYTNRNNWVIGDFLNKDLEQPNLPVNLFIPGDPSKKPILMNSPITQKMYINAIKQIGGKG